MADISSILTRSVDTIYPNQKALEKRMKSGTPLRVYIGVDPTGNRLHLGHSIGLSKLQEFADAGHEAILLFGTGTVLVGDPSQRKEARKKITYDEIQENIKTWKKQVEGILDFEKITIKQNADWLLKLGLKEIIDIASQVTAVQLFKRESFQRRIEAGNTVWFHETLYPLLQGYDSVAMDVDLEIGGTDQMFNMLMGRELQEKMHGREKFVMTVPMIVGTDGAPMSKSSGNCVWLSDTPEDMYGKLMSMPDTVMEDYFNLLTPTPYPQAVKDYPNPLTRKKHLALIITTRFHDRQKAQHAEEYFEKTVQKGQTPEDIKVVSIPSDGTLSLRILDILERTHMLTSKSEAKRLIKEGAVSVNDKKIIDPTHIVSVKEGMIIKMGKRKYVRIQISQ